ncbi:CPBP family intramembrane glutamic endopeptidase [Nocardia spumae]|uniref:CPBP family intramembrane glutamic endopeptidase n=1 Tax=Nocardia spumae TaxID=2887190 RepID=UPI001D14FD2B|nr:CPBP family intramembrane glutamic endopeptidase [Nocardia spumae]
MRALSAAGTALVWSTVVLPRSGLGKRGRTVANVAFATAYATVFGGRPNWMCARGVRWGAASFGAIVAITAAAVAVPAFRDRMDGLAERDPEVGTVEWVAIHIPLGTAYSEELIFRGTLDPLLQTAVGPAGKWCGALFFGLWHISPARAAGDSVPATIAATAAGGLVFSWLRRRADSATAPALAHLALNACGVVAPRVARALDNRTRRR